MGQVYIGYDQNGLFKIGCTTDWRRRERQIMNMNPNFKIFFTIDTENERSLELELHKRFLPSRVCGEWFRLSADELQALVYEFKGYDIPIEKMIEHWKECVGSERL